MRVVGIAALLLLSGRETVGFHSASYSFIKGTRVETCQDNHRTVLSAKQKRKKNFVTVKQLMDEVQRDADRFQGNKQPGKKKASRSRRRKENPQQKYLYAAQRKALEKSGVIVNKSNEGEEEDDESEEVKRQPNLDKNSPITIARNLGLNPSLQSCDASFAVVETGLDGGDAVNTVISSEEPRIVGSLRVGDDDSTGVSGMYAYIIEKPAGWSIMDGAKKKKKKKANVTEGQISKVNGKKAENGKFNKKKDDKKKTKYYDKDTEQFDVVEYDEMGMLSVMTPEEIEEFEKEGGFEGMRLSDDGAMIAKAAIDASSRFDDDEMIEAAVNDAKSNFDSDSAKGNSAEKRSNSGPATFSSDISNPSVVSWLKDLKAAEGSPIRGGKFWTALAGAVEVDDSGLVLLCPKDRINDLYVDFAKYTTVVGNGKVLAPKGKKKKQISSRSMASLEQSQVEIVAKLRKGRDDDVVLTTEVQVPDGASTTNDAVQICQKQFQDGVRGDPNANPFDRRSNRRLVHCSSLSVSSLSYDDVVEAETEIPDDIRSLYDRRNHHEYMNGSFLGRASLKDNVYTTAYREINGAADGFPGWIVDRYDAWLFVQHDQDYERGPLPSLHDGNTAGVYYFSTERDRSITGSEKGVKPMLMEGQPAPETIAIKENGIVYHVNFEDLSTGIFLDQRSQRAWLSRFCTPDTKVLNCFSHCGAFSVAAGTAGAETVSLDLDKKWLDRVHPQLKANGIDDLDRHDCIFGDCKFFSFLPLHIFIYTTH